MTEKQIDYAYEVLSAVKVAMDQAIVKPELRMQLAFEVLKKAPDIFDSFMAIVQPEHRPLVYEITKTAMKLVKEWQPKT
jgi:hypothetical protein